MPKSAKKRRKVPANLRKPMPPPTRAHRDKLRKRRIEEAYREMVRGLYE